MQKVILDTNVVVSSLIQKSFPYYILKDLVLEKHVQLCLSIELMSEYYEVLNRDKFAKYPDFKAKADSILVDIERIVNFYTPKVKISKIKDESDNMLLELAEEAQADFLITGNTNDFTMKKQKKTKIITPREYWEDYMPQ